MEIFKKRKLIEKENWESVGKYGKGKLEKEGIRRGEIQKKQDLEKGKLGKREIGKKRHWRRGNLEEGNLGERKIGKMGKRRREIMKIDIRTKQGKLGKMENRKQVNLKKGEREVKNKEYWEKGNLGNEK